MSASARSSAIAACSLPNVQHRHRPAWKHPDRPGHRPQQPCLTAPLRYRQAVADSAAPPGRSWRCRVDSRRATPGSAGRGDDAVTCPQPGSRIQNPIAAAPRRRDASQNHGRCSERGAVSAGRMCQRGRGSGSAITAWRPRRRMPAFSIAISSSRWAQKFNADAGDHRAVGIKNVGGVQAATEAHLDYPCVQPGKGKQVKRRQRRVFKRSAPTSPRAASTASNAATSASSVAPLCRRRPPVHEAGCGEV